MGVWHLDETSGTHYDSTRNYHNGTPENGVIQDASGRINGADNFDGVDDYVEVPDSSSLDITNAVTIEAWINSPDFKNQYPGIACKWDWSSTDPQRSYSLYLMDYTKPCVMTSENGTYLDQLVSIEELSTNTWYHLTGVSTGSKWILYINGEFDCEKVIVTTIHSGTAKFSIGASMKDGSVATDETFKGIIDEVRISNVARDNNWISTSYNNQNSPGSFYSVGEEEVPETGRSEDTLKSSYPSTANSGFFEDVAPGSVKNVYFWISIPADQWGGTYMNSIYVKAVKDGLVP
jgi:hypothetical protein